MRRANRICAVLAGVFLPLAFVSGGAQADNVTANMDVTLTILPGCSFGFTSNGKGGDGSISFKQVTELNKDISGDTTLYVRCSAGSDVQYTIAMDKGLHYGNNSRNMQMGGDTAKRIGYKICLPTEAGGANGCGTVWGDGRGWGTAYSAKWDKSDNVKNIPVHVVVPAVKTNLTAGDYTDTVTLQFTWPQQ